MKVGAFLIYMARLKGVKDFSPERAAAWLERLNLAGVQDKKCEELSKGMLQKVQLIAAVLHEPDLLILDEPFSGLDPVNMRLLRELILAEHRRGATIIFSTHVMVHAEEICNHIVMLHKGCKVLDEELYRFGAGTIPGHSSSSLSSAVPTPPFRRDRRGRQSRAKVTPIASTCGTAPSPARHAGCGRGRAALAARSASSVARGHLRRARDMSKIFLVANAISWRP